MVREGDCKPRRVPHDGNVQVAGGEADQRVADRPADQVGRLRVAFASGRKTAGQPESFQHAAGQSIFQETGEIWHWENAVTVRSYDSKSAEPVITAKPVTV